MSILFGNPSPDGFPYLQDEEYAKMLEQTREQLLKERASVLSRCHDAAKGGAKAEQDSAALASLHSFLSEEGLLLQAIEREVSRIHWDSGSLFRQALSQDEKRAVCRMLAHLEELERSLKQLLGLLNAREQDLQAELREADGTLLFLKTVLLCATEDLEISSLCNSASARWEQLRLERHSLLKRVTKAGELLTPLLRQQLPYACGEILKHADLDGTENSGNVRELLSLTSSLSAAVSSALSRGEFFFLSDYLK